MKVLISDYSSDLTSEPLYLSTCFNQAGCKSTLLTKQTSLYDGFDMCKPDVFITHHDHLSKDLLIYLTENTNHKIDLIINITGIGQDYLTKLDTILSENKIKPTLYFINYYDHSLASKNNIVSILPAADLFLTSEAKQYEIEYALMIQSKEDATPLGDTYHTVTTMKNIDQIADIFLPVHRLCHLYPNYKSIVFRYFNGIFPQAFFDAAIRTDSVFFELVNNANKKILDKQLKKLLGGENYCSLSSKDSGKIKNITLNKHTCYNRAKSLLSQLPAKEYVDNLQKILENRGKE